MTILAVVDKNIPDLATFKSGFRHDIEIIDGPELRYRTKFNEISSKTYSRIALCWNKVGNEIVPLIYSFGDRPDPDRKLRIKPYEKGEYFSNRMKQFLNNLKNQNSDLVVDLICCDLNSQSFIDYITNFTTETGIRVNYSVDKTGNPNAGGDWIMESSGENIKDIYFDDEINNYHYVLAANTITVTGANTTTLSITQAYMDANGDAGATFTGNTVNITENIRWDPNWHIQVANTGNNQVTINGGNNTITISATSPEFAGLVESVIGCDVIIKNIIITGGNIAANGGWIVQNMQNSFDTVITIDNCHADTIIDEDYAGGIGGNRFGESGVAVIKNCSFTGDIGDSGEPDGLGGMAGQEVADDGVLTIYNCYATGIIEYQSGGILGEYAGQNDGKVYIYNCYSTGNITGTYAGGICGEDCAYDSGRVYITNCYSTGEISGGDAGGICGENCGSSSGRVWITNCYSTGEISASGAGGIIGSDCGDSSDTEGVYIYNCYSTGEISGTDAGGILGDDAAGDSSDEEYIYIINCFTTGNISGTDAGGLMGGNGDYVFMYGCYTTGNISGENSGGICGNNTYSDTSVYGCYTTGTITGTNAGGICGDGTTLARIAHCYSTRATYTTYGSNEIYDGSLTYAQIYETTFLDYGFTPTSTYPALKNFQRTPWTGYTLYNDTPARNTSYINIPDAYLDVLKINTMRSNIESDVNGEHIVIPMCIMNDLSSTPLNAGWMFFIMNSDPGDATVDVESVSTIDSGDRTEILSRLNTHYNTNVTSGFSFDLYDGSILAATLDISCVEGDTEILTTKGYVKIKNLKAGVEIITRTGIVSKIKNIIKFRYTGDICTIKQNRIIYNKPFKTFKITPDHKIRLGHKWKYPPEIGKVKNHKKPMMLYHIEIEETEDCSVKANGMWIETWKPHELSEDNKKLLEYIINPN